MKASKIVHMESFRGRKDIRLRQTLALHGNDPERLKVLQQLWKALGLVGAERGAILWLDEYGPGLAHAYALLDLASDTPRRLFSAVPLRSAWDAGVPGLLDLHSVPQNLGLEVQGIQSLSVVSLGSDGPRSWFLYLDARTARRPLSQAVAGELMFLAGECASVILHRDLERVTGAGGCLKALPPRAGKAGEPFAGWPVLQDIEERRGDDETSLRIATRFLVARVVRGLVEDDLVTDPESLRHQVAGVREEMASHSPTEVEMPLWDRVLSAVEGADQDELLRALLEWGSFVEGLGHFSGALELHALAFELAVALGDVEAAVDAGRFRGRVLRKTAQWTDAVHWYGVAEKIAREAGFPVKLAVVLDGLANAYRDRGNLPKARNLLAQVLDLGLREENRYAQAIAHHDLLTVEKEAGNLDSAIVHGWQAVRTYDAQDGRLFALFDLAGVLREAGELAASWDAYAVVEAQVGTYEYKILALDAMAYIAALNGHQGRYEDLRARVDRMGWDEDDCSAVVRGQVLLYRGLSCRALNRLEEAGNWLSRALSFAEEHELNKLIFEAEAVLKTEASTGPTTEGSPGSSMFPGSAVQEVRQGLQEMREALAGVGEAL